MPTRLEAAQQFLTLPRIALVGVSRHPKDFSRAVFRALEKAGREVVPVHPSAEEIEGRFCFARLTEVRPWVDGAVLMVAPEQAEPVVRDAIAAGIHHLWFHRGVGPGSASPAALALAASANIAVVDGLCPFMALTPSAWFHRAHGYFRRKSLERQDREVRALPA